MKKPMLERKLLISVEMDTETLLGRLTQLAQHAEQLHEEALEMLKEIRASAEAEEKD